MDDKQINCFYCEYFYITWEVEFPRGCKAMDFKSLEMPSVVVRRTSGMDCQQFAPKSKRRKKT